MQKHKGFLKKSRTNERSLSLKATLLVGLLFVSNLSFNIAVAQNLIPESNQASADAVAPADVENVKAKGGDKKITLSWDTATDNVGVTGYKIYYGANSVTNDGGSYTNGPVDVKNVISYDVTNLTNGTKYYFAVTAYDAAGNESVNYSLEVSGTPAASAANTTTDTVAPKVVKAESVNINTVKVTFSEAVMLPAANAQSAFSLKEDLTSVALEVKEAKLDTMDTTEKTVLITTGDQKAGKNYILTAGIDIKDKSGNPIISGTSDTGAFIGKDTKSVEDLKPAPDTTTPTQTSDTTAPAFVNVTALNNNTVEVTFSEPVVLKTDARENFIITEEQNVSNVLAITKVVHGATGMIVTLTTDPQKGMNYNLIAVDVADQAGNKISIENNATMFKGVAPAVTTPNNQDTPSEVETLKPGTEGAKDLMAKVLGKLVIGLTWSRASENLADIANFVVYMSTDRGKTYGEGVVLGPNVLNYDFNNLTPGMMYYFKLTTRNAQGQESQGLVTSLMLPGTGPELGLLLLGSLGAGRLLQKKKKKISKK